MMPHSEALAELVSLYAVGALEQTECLTVRAHISECAQCREQYARDAAAATALALAAAETPPASLRTKTLRAAMQGSYPVPSRAGLPAFARAFLAAAAVALIAVTGAYFWRQHPAHEGNWIAVCAPAQANCGVTGRIVAAGDNSMVFEAHGLKPLPNRRVYQAWVIRPGGKPEPEPTFTADRQGNGLVRIPASAAKGMTVAITIEPQGGSAAPTTKPFLAAAIN